MHRVLVLVVCVSRAFFASLPNSCASTIARLELFKLQCTGKPMGNGEENICVCKKCSEQKLWTQISDLSISVACSYFVLSTMKMRRNCCCRCHYCWFSPHFLLLVFFDRAMQLPHYRFLTHFIPKKASNSQTGLDSSAVKCNALRTCFGASATENW